MRHHSRVPAVRLHAREAGQQLGRGGDGLGVAVGCERVLQGPVVDEGSVTQALLALRVAMSLSTHLCSRVGGTRAVEPNVPTLRLLFGAPSSTAAPTAGGYRVAMLQLHGLLADKHGLGLKLGLLGTVVSPMVTRPTGLPLRRRGSRLPDHMEGVRVTPLDGQ